MAESNPAFENENEDDEFSIHSDDPISGFEIASIDGDGTFGKPYECPSTDISEVATFIGQLLPRVADAVYLFHFRARSIKFQVSIDQQTCTMVAMPTSNQFPTNKERFSFIREVSSRVTDEIRRFQEFRASNQRR